MSEQFKSYLPLGQIQFFDVKSFLQAHVQTLLRHNPPFRHVVLQHDDPLGKKKVRLYFLEPLSCMGILNHTYLTLYHSYLTHIYPPFLLPTYLPIPTHPPTYTYPSTYLRPPIYLPTYLYPAIHLPTYLPLPTHPPIYLHRAIHLQI